MTAAALELSGVSKYFGSNQALAAVSLTIQPGEVRGLVGENGAGKSTLVKIIQGVYSCDEGTVELYGEDAAAVRDRRVATLHQEIGLADEMTVLENLRIGAGFGRDQGSRAQRLRPISWRSERRIVSGLMDDFGVHLAPGAKVETLSSAQKAIVGIMRVLRTVRESGDERVLFILDEPTASVSPLEIAPLFRVIKQVAHEGGAVIYISHKLDEVVAVSDRISVVRAARMVGELESSKTTIEEVGRMMSGAVGMAGPDAEATPAPAADGDAEAPHPAGVPVLEIEGIAGTKLEPTSLRIEQGEIIGLAGLAGMGPDELIEIVGGIRAPLAGTMRLDGESYSPPSIHDAWQRGVRTVPSDRRRRGAWLEGTVGENLTIGDLASFNGRVGLGLRRERAAVKELIEFLGIHPPDPKYEVGRLSGGNQQRVLFGRVFLANPRLVILDQPTEGVDPRSRREILGLVRNYASTRNAGILVLSSEFEELVEICDAVHVFRYGADVGRVRAEEKTRERLEALSQGSGERIAEMVGDAGPGS